MIALVIAMFLVTGDISGDFKSVYEKGKKIYTVESTRIADHNGSTMYNVVKFGSKYQILQNGRTTYIIENGKIYNYNSTVLFEIKDKSIREKGSLVARVTGNSVNLTKGGSIQLL